MGLVCPFVRPSVCPSVRPVRNSKTEMHRKTRIGANVFVVGASISGLKIHRSE